MALNTEFPAWMQQQTRDDTAAGVAIGRNLLEGFRLQQEQIRHEAEAPVRAAQLEAYRAQTKANVNRANAEAFALIQKQKQLGSMADAMALESDIAGSENGYTNPENRARFFSFLKSNPHLVESEWAAGVNKKFELSDAMALKEQKLLNDIEIAKSRALEAEERRTLSDERLKLAQEGLQLQKTRLDQQAEEDRVAAMDEAELLEHFNGDQSKVDVILGQRKGGYIIPKANELVKNIQGALKPYGVVLSDAQKSDIKAKSNAGVTAINAPVKFVGEIQEEAAAYELLDQVSESILNYNKKYGKNAFDQVVGPVDNPVFKAKASLIPLPQQPAAIQEARSIFEKAKQVIQGYRNEQFGTALTSNETTEFRGIVGDPKFADYTRSLSNFRNTLGDRLKVQVGNNEFAPNIPTPIKARFLYGATREAVESATRRTVPQGTTSPTGTEPTRIRIKLEDLQ